MNEKNEATQTNQPTQTSSRLRHAKTRVMTLRVTDEEHLRYSKAAKWMNLSLSDFFRNALDGSTVTYRSTPKVKKQRNALARHVDRDLLYEINRIGSNMNQIAKALNTINLTDEEVSSRTLLLALIDIESRLETLITQNETASANMVEQAKEAFLALMPEQKKSEDAES